MKEVMVPYVLKLPPKLIAQVREQATKCKNPRRWWRKGMTASAFIRRAIERDLEHFKRSRSTASNTKKAG